MASTSGNCGNPYSRVQRHKTWQCWESLITRWWAFSCLLRWWYSPTLRTVISTSSTIHTWHCSTGRSQALRTRTYCCIKLSCQSATIVEQLLHHSDHKARRNYLVLSKRNSAFHIRPPGLPLLMVLHIPSQREHTLSIPTCILLHSLYQESKLSNYMVLPKNNNIHI